MKVQVVGTKINRPNREEAGAEDKIYPRTAQSTMQKNPSPPIPALPLGETSSSESAPQQKQESSGFTAPQSLFDLNKYLISPRTPREVLPSPRPLPSLITEAASPSQQRKKRRSLNGTQHRLKSIFGNCFPPQVTTL